MLSDWAVQDSFTDQYGPNAFGPGKLNVLPLNDPPVALVTAVNLGTHLLFDASASYDPEDFPLTYKFKVEAMAPDGGEKPKDYHVTVDGARLTLEPESGTAGYYRVKLFVNDSVTNSRKIYSSWIFLEKD